MFDASGLDAARRYTLELRRGRTFLTEPWELSTFPAPEATPERFRLLLYTCAIMSGDIHSVAEGLITRSGAHDFSRNPVISVITGTPGTRSGWPSLARGSPATPPTGLDVEPVVPVQEVDGFHIADFEPDKVTIQHFAWNIRRDPPEAIDTLMPFHVSEYSRLR